MDSLNYYLWGFDGEGDNSIIKGGLEGKLKLYSRVIDLGEESKGDKFE